MKKLEEGVRMKIQNLTYKLGFSGPMIITIGSLLTAFAYTGKLSEPYSFLNHFISELGEVGVSEWALVFNVSLFVGGLCITGFMLGAAWLFNNLYGVIFGFLGLVTGISGSLVGIFPMNNLDAHIVVAMWFFRAALLSSAVFRGLCSPLKTKPIFTLDQHSSCKHLCHHILLPLRARTSQQQRKPSHSYCRPACLLAKRPAGMGYLPGNHGVGAGFFV